MQNIKTKNIFSIINIILIIIPLFIMLFNLTIANESVVTNIWYYTILCLGILSLGLFFFYLYKIIVKNKIKIEIKDFIPIILLTLFLIWAFITTLLSDNIVISLLGNNYRHEGFLTYIAYAGYLLTAILVKNKDKNKFYNLFVLTGVLLSLATIKKCYFNDLLVGISSEYQSVFHQFNHFGYFLMMALICGANLYINENSKLKKIIYFVSFCFLMRMLIINDTFGSYIALSGALGFMGIYYIFVNKKRKSFLIILIAFLIFSIDFNDFFNSKIFLEFKENFLNIVSIDYQKLESEEEMTKLNSLGTGRGLLWTTTLSLIKDKPITGYGLDNIKSRMYELQVYNDRPHNIILQMTVYTGIPGMLLYVSSLIVILYKLLKRIKNMNISIFISLSVVVGYLLSSIVHNSMYYTTPYFMIFLGFCLSDIYKEYIDKYTV